MTIVKDHHNMGHTILTVRTDKGDFILDNFTDDILSWDETGYHFLKRQSQEDPNVWLAILSPAPRESSARARARGALHVCPVKLRSADAARRDAKAGGEVDAGNPFFYGEGGAPSATGGSNPSVSPQQSSARLSPELRSSWRRDRRLRNDFCTSSVSRCS